MEMMIEGETVYNSHDESHIVMSEKVQSLAGTIYQEFERMISKYDEDVVKDLMPLVVNILECLDLAYTENQEHEVEVELLREDNEQLVTQYEREKQLRKAAEQRLLELDDTVDEERKQCQTKVESLESIVRMFELKNRNATDHASRLEDKVDELKKEYTKLHERYTDLFKTHMDYMERTKILYGTDRLDQLGTSRNRLPGINLCNLNSFTFRSSGPVSYGFSSLDPNKSLSSPVDLIGSTNGANQLSSLRNELQEAQVGPDTPVVHTDRSQLTDAVEQTERGTATKGGWVDGFSPETEEMEQSSPEIEDLEDISMDMSYGFNDKSKKFNKHSTTTTSKEERTGNTLYQELQFQEPDALADVDEGADITGGWVHPGEYASSDSGSEKGSEKVTDNFFGMGKEVENLILENTELLTTKNALNIVKDDLIAKVDELTSEQEILREEINSLNAVKSRLRLRVQELEDEIKKMKEEFEKNKANKSDDEEDVPMAQRKRFTRVEMARVLMERNQYKERFMELQEAVRWTEMIRASRNDPEADKKNKQGIWKFFSNLFSTSEKPMRKPLPYGNIRYNAPNNQVTPALDTMRRRNLVDHRRKGLEFFDSELPGEESQNEHTNQGTALTDLPSTSSSEKLQQRRAIERREQYKQVRAHVKKDDGRMQAYGWSLPAKTSHSGGQQKVDEGHEGTSQTHSSGRSSHIPVPVPVYCRPLMEKEPGMKIWCAAGVNLTGGRTKDGGSVVGASVFYNEDSLPLKSNIDSNDEVNKLDMELEENEKDRKESEGLEQALSSLVWICTSTHSISKVTVIDANNPADILESFHVCSSHLLCIASVPGAKESDWSMDDDLNRLVEESQQLKRSASQRLPTPDGSQQGSLTDLKSKEDSQSVPTSVGTLSFINCGAGTDSNNDDVPESPTEREGEEIKPILRKETIDSTDPEKDADRATIEVSDSGVPLRRFLKDPEGVIKDGVENEAVSLPEISFIQEEVEKMSSVLATMWLGSQNGSIYVHSAVRQWKRSLHSIKLKDSVLSIVHLRGRVLAALADGTVAIFHRKLDCQWDLTNYHLLDLGRPHHSIRCMHVVNNKVWCGYRNKVHVVNPKNMCVEKSFDAHPRKESQVRQMAWIGDGVWVSIRLDSTLRLYHAHTHEHLQDVDIEPYVSKMLGTGKLGFSFVRITALLISTNRLWIGTGNGVIISVPLSENSGTSNVAPALSSIVGARMPGGVVRVYADSRDQVSAGSFIPYCSMAQAQLSFHGHRDAVKFFVAVPGLGGYPAFTAVQPPAITAVDKNTNQDEATEKSKSMLVLSGGEGYIDFRIAEETEEDRDTASHLLVWHIPIEDNLSYLNLVSTNPTPPDLSLSIVNGHT